MKREFTKEPIIHSHITDALYDHPLAQKIINCAKCEVMLHAPNDECMQTWFETEFGNYCTACFRITDVMEDYLEDQLAL